MANVDASPNTGTLGERSTAVQDVRDDVMRPARMHECESRRLVISICLPVGLSLGQYCEQDRRKQPPPPPPPPMQNKWPKAVVSQP